MSALASPPLLICETSTEPVGAVAAPSIVTGVVANGSINTPDVGNAWPKAAEVNIRLTAAVRAN
jgi:hypothetical protein